MKFRQLLPMLLGFLLMGAPVIGDSGAGTPASIVSDTESTSAQTSPWEDVVVTDALEINEKTAYYRVKPQGDKLIGDGKLSAYFSKALPEGVHEDLGYTLYPIDREYLIHLSGSALAVKAHPRFGAATVKSVGRYQHIATDGIVLGEYGSKTNSSQWYRVRWGATDAPQIGYVFSAGVTHRGFQFNKMVESINHLKVAVEKGKTAHVDNYKNRAGWAPAHMGQQTDDFGNSRDQSAPAYFRADTSGDFRYLTDGSLVTVLGEQGDFFEISSMDFDGILYVPKKYLSSGKLLTTLEKVVVVDRKNQNEAVFERSGQGWKLISYLLATTGEKAQFKEETSLGNFMVIEKKSKFMYLGDVSKEIEGYAPFALRFNGGAYIHGVPVNYKDIKSKVVVAQAVLDPLGNIITPAVTRDVVVGRKDPGIQEFLSTIGTTPRSHKCVRNYTSHAKFLYDWAEVGKTAVIVIE